LNNNNQLRHYRLSTARQNKSKITYQCIAALLTAALMPSSSFANKSSGTLEEILVTARKRSESMQTIPIAVSALTGQDLLDRGISNTKELTKIIPSLEIREGQANQIYIRGIGERTGFARVDPAVGVYLDDLFLPRSDGQLLDTVDVQSIQVLRGPQGTLFGKNTTGGALVVSLIKPNDSNEAYIDVGAGNVGQRHLKAAINIPISDTFYSRVAVNINKNEGYIEDISSGRSNSSIDRQSLLFQTRWEANESFSIDTQAFLGKVRENFPGANCNVPSNHALYIEGLWVAHPGDTDPSNLTAFRENCESNSRQRLGDLKSNQGQNAQLNKELDTLLFAATTEWEIRDSLSFKTVIGLRGEKEGPIQSSDTDGGPALWGSYVNTEDSNRRSYSLELQLNGDAFSQRLNYTTGFFLMHETNTEDFTITNTLRGLDAQTVGEIGLGEKPTRPISGGTIPLIGFVGAPLIASEFDLANTTAALFAQGSFDLTQQLEITLGFRITAERRESELTTLEADMDAIGARITGSGLFGNGITAGVFGPSAEGFYPYLGPLGWRDDPVSIAAALFPDANGDALLDYPVNPNSFRKEAREEVFTQSTPMLSVSYTLPERWLENSFVDSSMLYATWSRGFKSGFFEPRGIDGLQKIEPEVVTNHEIGFKVDAFDRSLRINAAFYAMDFNDQQLIAVGADSQQNIAVVFSNAGKSEIRGAEFEINWLPLPALAFNAALSINNYRYLEFTELDLQAAVIGQEKLVDRTDETFPVTPDKSASIGVQYTWSGDFGELTPRIDVSYKSAIFYGFDPGSYAIFKQDEELAGQPAYALIDARLSWQNPAGDTTVSGWVKNLSDERYRIGVVAVADSSGIYNQAYGEPRMFGIDIRKTY
jgi:iron complex outermembrane receptor protein